jgi:hypothetical protein
LRSASAPAARRAAARPGRGRRLLVSQLITLYLTPVVYTYLGGLVRTRKIAPGAASPDPSPA